MPCRRLTRSENRTRPRAQFENPLGNGPGRPWSCPISNHSRTSSRKAAPHMNSSRKCPLDRLRHGRNSMNLSIPCRTAITTRFMHLPTTGMSRPRRSIGARGRRLASRSARQWNPRGSGQAFRTVPDVPGFPTGRKWRARLVQQPVGVQASAHGRCGRSAVRDKHSALVGTWRRSPGKANLMFRHLVNRRP